MAVTKNFDVENPGYTAPGVLQDIRLTDRDVILARTDLPASELKLSNANGELPHQRFSPHRHYRPVRYDLARMGFGRCHVGRT